MGSFCITTAPTVSQQAAKKETAVPAQGDYCLNILTLIGQFPETSQMML